MRFKIGDSVYAATYEMRQERVVCSGCAGHGNIRFLMPLTDEIKTAECPDCAWGYEGSHGYVNVSLRMARATLVTLSGVEINGEVTRWRAEHYTYDDSTLFTDRESALACAEKIALVENARELARVNDKEKPSRSWAWNATYHRRCIKDAQRQIAYHESKLNVASLKAKESKS